MKYSKQAWDQLKSKSPEDLMAALERDGATRDVTRGAIQVYRYPHGKRVTIHYHPRKTYPPGLLKDLLNDIGWNENDLRRLKLIK